MENEDEETLKSVSFVSFSSTESSSSLQPASSAPSQEKEKTSEYSEDSELRLLQKKRQSLPDLPQNRVYNCPSKKEKFPRSYYENNLKEDILMKQLCAEYTRSVSRIFKRRKPPLLILPNEVGTQKMVCTTVNISRLPFGLDTWQDIAQFLSQHIYSIPLAYRPTEFPTQLRSPNTVLRSQYANCLELSNLLVSLLNGIRTENAYVVLGYATRQICVNDQSTKPCPVSINIPAPPTVPLERVESDPYLIALPEDSKYKYDENKNRTYESKTDRKRRLDKEQAEQDKREAKEKEIELKKRNRREQMEKRHLLSPDPLYGHRIHSWVLAFENYKPRRSSSRKRSRSQRRSRSPSSPKKPSRVKYKPLNFPYFIEPSTGERHEVNDENYLGIIAVWNHNNYWFNRQHTPIGSFILTFNLNNRKAWKPLIDKKVPRVTVDFYSRKKRLSASGRSRSNSRLNSKVKKTEYYKDGTTIEDAKRKPDVPFMMPHSWTETVTLTRCKYLDANYGGRISRRTKYYKTILDQFQELAHPEGLVTKILYFMDAEYKILLESLEEYKFRKDKLKYRRVNYMEKTMQEYFLEGRRDTMQMYSVKVVNGRQEFTVDFCAQKRLDRMKSLHAECSNRIRITFENRIDQLQEMYGETLLEYHDHKNANQSPGGNETEMAFNSFPTRQFPTGQFVPPEYECPKYLPSWSTEEKRIISFAQVFYKRNPERPSNEDVQTVIFHIPLDTIEVDYHSEAHHLTHKRITIDKTEVCDDAKVLSHVKYHPRNPYEQGKLELPKSLAILGSFTKLRTEVLAQINHYENLMKDIYNDRTRIKSKQELLPENKMGRLPLNLDVEEKVEDIKRDFQERLYIALKRIQ